VTTAYDRVRYVSHAYFESHPDRMRLVAHLFHLAPAPAPVEACRVLEIGCAAGGNLIPMAEALPESRFLGIDLAASSIDEGRAAVAALGLGNIELRAQDLAAFPRDAGAFDYILAHGVYSWIPPAAKDALLDLIARHLAPGGVAYLSHNVKPGWVDRGLAGAMMRYHAGATPGLPLEEQVEQGLAFLAFVAEGTRNERWATRLRGQIDLLATHPPWLLYHDLYSAESDACWFHELAAALATRGLAFLGDADIGSMIPSSYPPETRALLERLAGDDPIRHEQLMDCLANRGFRLTLTVRASAALERSIHAEQAADLWFSADMTEAADGKFRTHAGAEVTIGRDETRAALRRLAALAPGAARLAELGGEPGGALARDLMHLVLEGFLEASLGPARCVAAAGPRPRAPGHVRLAAARGDERITNGHHKQVVLAREVADLVQLLDGTRDRAALAALTGVDPAELERRLAKVASGGLLVA
jgi:SAM-dependent methyltransferase